MKSYGLLGIVFVVLFFLGYATNLFLVIGFLLVLLEAFMSHSYDKQLQSVHEIMVILISRMLYDLEEPDSSEAEE